MKIDFKELNNKSRKGTYIYIKEPKTQGKYYKYDIGDNIDGIVDYYQHSKSNKTRGSLKEYKSTYGSVLNNERGKKSKLRSYAQQKKYKKGLGKKFNEVLKKGIGTAKTNNLHDLSIQEIQRINEALLEPIVKDAEIRRLVATEHNLQKLKHRIETQITIRDASGNKLDTITTFNQTLNEVVNKIKQYLPLGITVEEGSKSTYQNRVNVSRLGKNNVESEGLLQKTELVMMFRKN